MCTCVLYGVRGQFLGVSCVISHESFYPQSHLTGPNMCLSCMHTLVLPISFGVLCTSSQCAFQLLFPPPLCWAVCLVLPTPHITPSLQQPRQRECSYEQMQAARSKALCTMLATLHRPATILHCPSLAFILKGKSRSDGITPAF